MYFSPVEEKPLMRLVTQSKGKTRPRPGRLFSQAVVAVVTLVLLCSAHHATAQIKAFRENSCKDCHPQNNIGRTVHPPFVNGQCDACHARKDGLTDSGKIDRKKIKWFLRRSLRNGTAYTILSRQHHQQTLVFESDEPESQTVFSLSASLPPLPEDGTNPPRIVKTSLCGAKKTLWWDAKLCIETDKPALLEVSCEDNLGHGMGDFLTDQEVLITGLNANQEYDCQIVAQDIRGRKSDPTPFHFKTNRTFSESALEPAKKLSIETSTIEGESVLAVKADGEVEWRIGFVPDAYGLVSSKDESSDLHGRMSPMIVAAITACYDCHPKVRQGLNHPVDVKCSAPTIAPADLPLFEGAVGCASCHNPHANNEPFLLRKHGHELCVSCHGEHYFPGE
jgi:predicted CXXCH cytochrome family protein